jgi:multidrug resistance efflux pump
MKSDDTDNIFSELLSLEQAVREAQTLLEVTYLITNETQKLAPYTQAVLFQGSIGERQKVIRLSHLSVVDRTAPFVTWIEAVAMQVTAGELAEQTHLLDPEEITSELRRDWVEFTQQQLLWIPLNAGWRGRQGVLVLGREQPWQPHEQSLLSHLAGSYAMALHSFAPKLSMFKNTGLFRWGWWVLSIVLILVMFMPVRLTVLSPAEITPFQPHPVTAPMDGVVAEIKVTPNQLVSPETLLVTMESSELASALELAWRSLNVAQAKLHQARQAGFIDVRKQAEVAGLKAELKLRKSEWEYAKEHFQRSQLTAPISGIAIVNQPHEWKGRPVSVGERIMQIADPKSIEVTMQVGVHDAISLEPGGEVKVFLDIEPLTPLSATIIHASYEPQLTAAQIPAYRVTARFNKQEIEIPLRIGLRGIAKSYGQEVSLFYYLFRRPITTVRQWLGW